MVKGDAFGPTVKRATAATSNQRESYSGRACKHIDNTRMHCWRGLSGNDRERSVLRAHGPDGGINASDTER